MAELKKTVYRQIITQSDEVIYLDEKRKSAITTKEPFAGDPIFRPTVQKPEVLSLIRLNKE